MMEMQKVDNLLIELEEAYFDIPFENSAYQNRAFVMAAQLTPGRAYRAIGLRMFAKIRAIKELAFARQLEDVTIDEKRAVINDQNASVFDRRRAEIEINKLLDGRKWQDKLLNDALAELGTLHAEYCKLPQYTREQFEAEEAAHFEALLNLPGANASLYAMNAIDKWDAILLEAKNTHALCESAE